MNIKIEQMVVYRSGVIIMKKKFIILICALLFLIGALAFIQIENKYPYEGEDTLYFTAFDNEILRFERYDYALGQNQVVGVQKSVNKGKTFEKITEENIVVSMEAKFVFLNNKLGFAISKPNLTKNNDYMGVKVTQDGGKTFIDGKINYDNPNIEILTIQDVPYYDNKELKLKCSIYQLKEDLTGYEDVELIFVSADDGLTWNLSDKDKISMNIKENTLTDSGMTLILQNNTKQVYHYGLEYSLEK